MTEREIPQRRSDWALLAEDVIEFARYNRRYGYQMTSGLLNNAG